MKKSDGLGLITFGPTTNEASLTPRRLRFVRKALHQTRAETSVPYIIIFAQQMNLCILSSRFFIFIFNVSFFFFFFFNLVEKWIFLVNLVKFSKKKLIYFFLRGGHTTIIKKIFLSSWFSIFIFNVSFFFFLFNLIDLSEEALLSKHAVEIVRDLQRLDGIEGDYDEGSGSGPGRRKTIRNLEKSRRKTQAINTLDVAFRQRFFSLTEGNGKYFESNLNLLKNKYDYQNK